MKKVVLLTGSELRHTYFRLRVATHPSINVLSTYCEGDERSLKNRTLGNPNTTVLDRLHISAREQSERDFFQSLTQIMPDRSNPKSIPKGAINEQQIIDEICSNDPDLLVCYGSSLIKEPLISMFQNRFLNVHLGLSPYYRGSGTNVWPIINREPHMIGATFLHLDKGIDTGEIIHQFRADLFLGDSPHSIGNRLIKKMVEECCRVIVSFSALSRERQPEANGKIYYQRDFDSAACRALYENCQSSLIGDYLEGLIKTEIPYIVKNAALSA